MRILVAAILTLSVTTPSWAAKPKAVKLKMTLAEAAPVQVNIDSKTSKVGFGIFKFKINAEVTGVFEKFSGTMAINEKTKLLTAAKGIIEAASIKTDSSKRDRHLKSGDFFDVEKYPTLTFDLKSHTGKPESGKVTGMLTIKGISKEVTLDAVVKNSDTKTYEIALNGVINRKDFNIIWNAVLDKGGFVLADEVKLDLLIKAAN